MAVRPTMSDLISRVSVMIGDPGNSQFSQQQVQDYLDANREDIRFEPLQIAPTIVSSAATGNVPLTIFADYYSRYQWWEQDIVLSGTNMTTNVAWAVLNPAGSDFIVGHFQFELTPFVNGTAPGQYPPIFATGKVYDPYAAAADLLEFWAAALASAYDLTTNGQSLHRSQLMTARLKLADQYRRRAKPKRVVMRRDDVVYQPASRQMRLLDSGDDTKGY